MGLSLMGVVMLAGSFSLVDIVEAQQRGSGSSFPQFVGFVVFLIAGLAETRRIPFDLPEAESELVAGYHTEYSGMKFGMFFIGEYVGVTLISALIVDPVLRRLAAARCCPADRLVPDQDGHLDLALHPGARHASRGPATTSSWRSAGRSSCRCSLLNLLVTGPCAAGAGMGVPCSSLLRRTLGGLLPRLPAAGRPSSTRSEMPYLPPRYRGRIILSRDPDGEERCVACYLCAVACPVDCIALQATEDENGRRYPEFFRINFSAASSAASARRPAPPTPSSSPPTSR